MGRVFKYLVGRGRLVRLSHFVAITEPAGVGAQRAARGFELVPENLVVP